jgi:clan AA aspartic protease
MRLTGNFQAGRPQFVVQIEGPAASLGGDYSVILDTGFDGFACMPSEIGIDLGITRESMAEVVLADGQVVQLPTAECTVFIENKEASGMAYLAPTMSDVLLGVEFLERMNLRLIVDPKKQVCELTDD